MENIRELELHETIQFKTPHGEFEVCVYNDKTTLRTRNGERLLIRPDAANAVQIEATR